MKAILLPALLAALCACTTESTQLPQAQEHTLLSVADAGTGVAITCTWDPTQQVLSTTFAPDQSQGPAHLYDIQLPISGLAGVGRPTLVEIAPHDDVRIVGSPVAMEQLVNPQEELAHYPPGPVTITTQLAGVSGGEHIELLLTYMACGERFCHPPITRQSVSITLPADINR